MKWDFTPYDLTVWNNSETRVLFVASEPNGDNPNNGISDMGEWFRTANRTNKYNNNKLFYNRCRIILKGILNSIDERKVFSFFRFMDLKATQGGATSSLNEVIDYVNSNLDEVVEYFISDDKGFGIAPTIVVVLGNNTQNAFESTIKPFLVKEGVSLRHVYMPHPSAQTVVNALLEKASLEINSKLAPISSVPYRWFCRGRKNYGWGRYKRDMQ